MKPILSVILVSFFIFGCGVNNMEKDAKKLAELTWKVETLAPKVDSGDKSALSKFDVLKTELNALLDEFQKKYPKEGDGPKFVIIYQKIYNEISKNPEIITVENEDSDNEDSDNEAAFNSESDKLMTETKEILKTHIFIKITDFSGGVGFSFDDTHFTFKVIAVNGTVLSKVSGTYQISAPIDNSIAKISLYREGPVEKSPLYADNQGIDTELFLHFNKELLLQKPTKESMSMVGGADIIALKKNIPEYILLGRDAFSADRVESQAEKDSIANEQSKMEEKKRVLEEKLKGF